MEAPGQLLLALINATAILVIVAAILVLVAIARINHFTENVVATMTEAVLSKVDLMVVAIEFRRPGRLDLLGNITVAVGDLGRCQKMMRT